MTVTPGRASPDWAGLDSAGMLAASAALGDHLERALQAPPRVEPLQQYSPFHSAVIAGMGGSGAAGAVLQALAERLSGVPVVAVNSYELPAFATAETLVVAISFSGDTEETLQVTKEAINRGCPILVMSGGGALAELAAASNDKRTVFHRLPGGIPQPRAGIAAMTAPLLLAAESLGLLPGAGRMLEDAAQQVRKRLPECLDGSGAAYELARRVGRTFPLVHGARGLGEVAARRFKTQVNENAKAPAFAGSQPEVCHNELCGFGQSGDVTRQLLTLVCMRLGEEAPKLEARFEAFADLAGEALAGVVDLVGEGDTELARFFDLVMIGDFASLHMAFAEGIDPGPVPVLTEVKRRLGEI